MAGLTSGERMVFAVAFHAALERGESGHRASLWAAGVVDTMRAAPSGFFIESPARAMLADMLGTGANRTSARDPTHEHAFEGDGHDCALCGEGRAHYLHVNGADR